METNYIINLNQSAERLILGGRLFNLSFISYYNNVLGFYIAIFFLNELKAARPSLLPIFAPHKDSNNLQYNRKLFMPWGRLELPTSVACLDGTLKR